MGFWDRRRYPSKFRSPCTVCLPSGADTLRASGEEETRRGVDTNEDAVPAPRNREARAARRDRALTLGKYSAKPVPGYKPYRDTGQQPVHWYNNTPRRSCSSTHHSFFVFRSSSCFCWFGRVRRGPRALPCLCSVSVSRGGSVPLRRRGPPPQLPPHSTIIAALRVPKSPRNRAPPRDTRQAERDLVA